MSTYVEKVTQVGDSVGLEDIDNKPREAVVPNSEMETQYTKNIVMGSSEHRGFR